MYEQEKMVQFKNIIAEPFGWKYLHSLTSLYSWEYLAAVTNKGWNIVFTSAYIIIVYGSGPEPYMLLTLIMNIVSLTQWGQVTDICVSKLTIIGSDNGLSPGRRQAIIWINAGILLIGPLGTNFSEILVGIQTFSFRKMHLKMSSAL